MYMYSLSNVDYIIMTILFGSFALIAYHFRRKNPTSQSFLLANDKNKSSLISSINILGIGLPEFLLFTTAGAIFGLPALCIVITTYIIIKLLINKFSENEFWSVIQGATKSSIHQRGLAIYYIVFLLLIAAIAVMTIVTLFKGLIAWEFGNSALSLMVVVGVCILIGGVISVFYGQLLATLITLVIMLITVILTIKSIGINDIVPNLQKIATSNGYLENQFVSLSFSSLTLQYIVLACFAVIIVILANPWSLFSSKTTIADSKFNFKSVIKALSIILAILIGVLALATPQPLTGNNGRVITTQEKMEDGTIGYVVRMVDKDKAPITREKFSSVIPLVSSTSQISETHYTLDQNQEANYNYTSAAIVLIKHIFAYAFIPLILLVSLFYRTISETISFATLLSINTMYIPYSNKTNEDLENLWAARVFMFMYFFVVIAIGLVFYKYFNYDFVFGVLAIFAMPVLVGNLLKANLFTMKLITLVGVLALLTTNINDVPSLFPMVNYSSWWSFCLIVPSIMFIVGIIVNPILNKVLNVK